TGDRHEGPGGITVEAPLDRLPLLVRAGAIVPMGPVMQYTTERPLDEVTLVIYPKGHTRFELYEDDGRTNAYLSGGFALTAFECATAPGTVTVRIGETSGDRSFVPAGRRYQLEVRMDPPNAASLAGHGELARLHGPHESRPGWWADRRGFVRVRLPD